MQLVAALIYWLIVALWLGCFGRSTRLLQPQSEDFWCDATIVVCRRIRHLSKHC
jgi:hypothetical protein